jgi:hypothetical protein
MNPYKNIEDVFYKVWKRTDSNQVEFLKSKLALASSEGYLNHMMVDLGAADVRSRALEMAASADSVNQLKRVHQHTTQEIERLPIRNDTPKKKLIELLTSEANWMYGTANEANAIKHYASKENLEVCNYSTKIKKKSIDEKVSETAKLLKVSRSEYEVGSNTQISPVENGDVKVQLTNETFTKCIGKYKNTSVYLRGRVDCTVGKKVIEVKNRQRHFMKHLSSSDIAQLQTYLYILDITDGELVEHLRCEAEEGGPQTRITTVKRDEIMWINKIAPHLLNFAARLIKFMAEPDEQRAFLLNNKDGKKAMMVKFGLG